jgi:hypothetical protein
VIVSERVRLIVALVRNIIENAVSLVIQPILLSVEIKEIKRRSGHLVKIENLVNYKYY